MFAKICAASAVSPSYCSPAIQPIGFGVVPFVHFSGDWWYLVGEEEEEEKGSSTGISMQCHTATHITQHTSHSAQRTVHYYSLSSFSLQRTPAPLNSLLIPLNNPY
jgi:hypothetical protein